jgi:hypothetical protein
VSRISHWPFAQFGWLKYTKTISLYICVDDGAKILFDAGFRHKKKATVQDFGAAVFAISSLRILLFVGQGQVLQPFL